MLDSRKWVVPEGIAIALDAMDAVLEKNIESLSKIFDHFIQMFKKISPAITIETIFDEYISLAMYAMKNYNHLICAPLKMWQLLNASKNERGWNNIFLIAELCFCAPCLNASLERFLSQMRIVKTDWRNSLPECNLTSLLRIKVSGPTLKVFVDKYCAKAVNNWYHDKDRRINQKPRKKYRKRKASKRVPVTLLVQNEQRKRGRGRGGRCYHFVKRIFLTCQMKVIHDLINYIIT